MKLTTKPEHIKFAVLTNTINSYGRSLLFNLCKQGFYPDCVIIEDHNAVTKRFYQFYRKNGFKEFFLETCSKLLKTNHISTYPSISKTIEENDIPVFNVNNHNNKECEEILKGRSINLILLGGTRIIRKNIFEIPRYGTLNAHPGLLYKYRGLDVMYWALKNNDDPVVSLHYVNEGIDLGRIIYKQRVDRNRFSNINRLEEEADRLSSELMIKAISELDSKRRLTTIKSNDDNSSKLYKRMKYNEKREIRQKYNAKSSH
ncbi:MAG: hypothetical protein HOG49_38655 [Candidatus Scalindua sp.]|nr:hypothetical protein [Candidatus Scalindua sp.]